MQAAQPLRYKDLLSASSGSERESLRARQKVAFVLPMLCAGGAERVLITLMNSLDRDRFDPEFLVLNEEGPLKSWIDPEIAFHSLGRARVGRDVSKLLGKLRSIRPDIVVSTPGPMNFGVLMLKPFLPRTRFIVREAVVPSSHTAKYPAWLLKQAYRRLYPRADRVISPASCIIEEFSSFLGMKTDNHVLLRNPVDVTRLRSAGTLRDQGADRQRTVRYLCAGRLHPQKGFDLLIESLARFHADFPWTLTILGEGEERSKLESLVVHKGLSGKVLLPGLSKQPWREMAQADALLLPSRWEGLPNVVLESLSVGTPVIASASAGGIGEIADICAPGAVTVAQDMDAFLRAMSRVRPDPVTTFRPSLLPEDFHLDTIMDRFSAILDGSPLPVPVRKPSFAATRRQAA